MSESTQIILEKDPSFLIEIWVWFAIGVLTIFLRMGVRLRTVGWRNFAGDDYLALFSLLMYTGDAFLVHICYHDGTNVDVSAEALPYLTDRQIDIVTRGSKAQLAAWYTYTALIWTMKFMVLFFYKRILFGTFQIKFIKPFFWLCGITYVAVFLTITFGCHPFHQNWQVRPAPSRECSFKPQNFYVGAVLNVLTDAILLSLPVPMLWGLQIRLNKKIAIGILLSSGIFVIAAAIIRAVLTLGSEPSGLNINRWGVRETIVGILTVNMPIFPPLFKRGFWSSGKYRSTSITEGSKSRTKGHYGNGTFQLRSGTTASRRNDDDATIEVASQSSQENIFKSHDENPFNRDVVVETSIDVQSHSRDEESSLEWREDGKNSQYHSNVTTTKTPF